MQSLQAVTLRHTPNGLSCTLDRASSGPFAPFNRLDRCPTWKLCSNALFDRQHTKSLSAVSAESEISLTDADDSGHEKFNWFKNWWPVQAVHNLPIDRPSRIQLLGKYYVVWKGHSGDWIAMDDECPHRLAPLSEGRIENDGNLLCSYHAWRFNEHGKCVKIPHAEDEKAHSVACNSPRSAVQTYPCKARGSLLFIWPDNSTNAFAESEKVLLPIHDDIADFLERSAAEGTFPMYVRYLPYSFDVLMENLCDPSHVAVSHHGLLPTFNRYKAKPLQASLVEGKTRGQATVTLKFKSPLPAVDHGQFELRKPSVVLIGNKIKDKDEVFVETHLSATPICAGRSAVFVVVVTPSQIAKKERASLLQHFFNRIMVLAAHTSFQNTLFDGDSAFLHQQDKKIRKHGASFNARKEYFAPSPADLLVMDFRKWFENEGGYGEAYGGNEQLKTGVDLTREEMLDRYEQHTKHCKVCRESLETIKHLSQFLKILSLGALFIGSFTLIQATSAKAVNWRIVLKSLSLWTATGVGFALAFVRHLIEKKIIPLFYFQDWVHADKD